MIFQILRKLRVPEVDKLRTLALFRKILRTNEEMLSVMTQHQIRKLATWALAMTVYTTHHKTTKLRHLFRQISTTCLRQLLAKRHVQFVLTSMILETHFAKFALRLSDTTLVTR